MFGFIHSLVQSANARGYTNCEIAAGIYKQPR